MIISLDHVAANGIILFFSVAEKYSIVCMCVCTYAHIHNTFFIHSSIYAHPFICGHVGCFRVLAIMNSAAMDIQVHVSF